MGEANIGTLNISHLFLANDTLIFCGARHDQIRTLRVLLLCFEAISRLKVNLAKSEVISIGGGGVPNVESMNSILGCNICHLPMKYLGLLLGVLFNKYLFGMMF